MKTIRIAGEELVVNGFDSRIPYPVHEELGLVHNGHGNQEHVTLVNDAGEHAWNQANIKCMVVDIIGDNGETVRVGYYADGAQTVLDELPVDCDSCDAWAEYWDRDGVVPMYLWGEQGDEEEDEEHEMVYNPPYRVCIACGTTEEGDPKEQWKCKKCGRVQ